EAGANSQYRILDHRRVQNEAHTGKGCEWLSVSANNGSYVHIAHDVGRPIVIDELMPSLWIKSDRSGMQLLARVVLPRSIDPKTGRPVFTLVAGTSYTDAGRWQELRITDVPRLLARQVRYLHGQLGPNVDEREAYIDAVLLNVYGGPGVTNVWIDDLDVAGYVSTSAPVQAHSINPSPRIGNTPADNDPSRTGAFVPIQPKRHEVKLSGSVLTVDGRPFFPRAIEHQGEPLEYLKKLGFNTVWLKRLPAQEILEEADKLGLWVICPAPRPTRSDGVNDPAAALSDVGPAFDPVLMWDLGGDLPAERLESTRRWVEQIRGADHRGERPLICRPIADLRGYSRLDNSIFLLIDRRPLGTSMELADYGTWVGRQPLLARPGTPVWTTVQTQANESLVQQIAALEPGNTMPPEVSFDRMRLMALTAIVANSRGLLFLSFSPLDADNTETRHRSLALQLLNLELEMVEPWAAAGDFVTTGKSSEKEVVAAILQAERARLLLPIWYSPGAQCVPAKSAAKNLSLVAPAPESAGAFEMIPGDLKPLSSNHVAGGKLVTLAEFGMTAQVLLAQDPTVISGIKQRSANLGRLAAQLERDLAWHKLYMVNSIAAQLNQRPGAKVPPPAWLKDAQKSLQWCDAQIAARQYDAAKLGADRAMSSLRAVERFYWDEAVDGKKIASMATSPAALDFQTLPCHWRLIDRIRGSRLSPNLLPGGDFENLDLMFQAGWRYLKGTGPGVQTAADLMAGSAHGGALGLRLSVTADDLKHPPAMLETPPIRFIGPSIMLQAGQIVCIHGWVNVPSPITGSVDGLMIFDSLGGEALADRVGHTAGWQEFALYRIAPQSGTLNVTFALTGLGEAWIDDVAVQVLDAPPVGAANTAWNRH
ncbi:MAG: hypothetical protein ABSA26_14345, partial [Thermoguttaceae bacterium]